MRATKEAYCKTNSRVKMVILTKPGEPNLTWYNYLKYNNRSTENIISNMKRRFLEKTKLVNITQVLQFYDNQTGAIIEKHIA